MNQNLRLSQTIYLSFVIFAIMFGAGNLIFPPMVGFQSGENVVPALIGFLITAVGLPIISIIAFATVGGNISLITDKVSKKFTFVYVTTVYLLIGPLFAIPRTAIVSNEMSILPFLPQGMVSISLFIFSFLYFVAIYFCCMYASKSISIISKYIIPILLATILVLIIGSIIWPLSNPGNPMGDFESNPLITGIIDGYLTMDTIATFIVVSMIITRLNEMNVNNPKFIYKNIIKASIIAALGLSIVYSGLIYIGVTSDVPYYTSNGGAILVRSAVQSFGFIGTIVLAISVFIACFTTALSLIISFARYFNSIIPSISYKNFVRIAVLFSFFISNLGFETLMMFTVPVLGIMYPLTIVIVIFTIFKDRINSSVSQVGLSICGTITVLFVIDDLITTLEFLYFIPLFKEGLGWMLPTFIGVIITYFITYKNKTIN